MRTNYQNPTAYAIAKTLKSGAISELEQLFMPLKNLGVNAFFYSRFQDSCRINCISNHAKWLQYLHDNIHTYKNNFETQFHFKPGFSIDLMNIFPKRGMIIEMSQHELNNGIYLSTVSRDKKSSEIFVFTTTEIPEHSNQRLLEKTSFFYQFTNYFKEKASQIIKNTQLTNNEIVKFAQQSFQKHTETNNPITLDRYYLGAPYDDIYLTKKEFNYVKELFLGKSFIEIANYYSIATQSVKTTFQELLNKLECKTYHELLAKIIYSPLFYPIFIKNNETPSSYNFSSDHSENVKYLNSHLTQRQKDCIFYLTKGMTIKQIAKKLNLAPKTIEHYLKNIRTKLNCKTRAELIIKSNHFLTSYKL